MKVKTVFLCFCVFGKHGVLLRVQLPFSTSKYLTYGESSSGFHFHTLVYMLHLILFFE